MNLNFSSLLYSFASLLTLSWLRIFSPPEFLPNKFAR